MYESDLFTENILVAVATGELGNGIWEMIETRTGGHLRAVVACLTIVGFFLAAVVMGMFHFYRFINPIHNGNEASPFSSILSISL